MLVINESWVVKAASLSKRYIELGNFIVYNVLTITFNFSISVNNQNLPLTQLHLIRYMLEFIDLYWNMYYIYLKWLNGCMLFSNLKAPERNYPLFIKIDPKDDGSWAYRYLPISTNRAYFYTIISFSYVILIIMNLVLWIFFF